MTYRKLSLTNVRVKSDFADSGQASPSPALNALVGGHAKSGDIRRDLNTVHLLKALVGVSYVATSRQQSAGRLVDILATDSRPIKWTPASTTPELSLALIGTGQIQVADSGPDNARSRSTHRGVRTT
jgi:hypothetical protein